MKRTHMIVATMLLALFLCLSVTSAQEKTVIRIANKWDEANKWTIAFASAAKAFMEKYPNIEVKVETAWVEDKYKMGVATGEAPDIYLVPDGPTWGANGFIQPLDELAAKYGVRRADYVPAAWDQYAWQGKLYAVPIQIDPNFGMIWNKTIFGESGLNPDHAPGTIQEFDQFFKRILRVNSDGAISRVAMAPWNVYGTNAVYTWGWLFGGEWFDYKTGKTTAHDPKNIKAWEYLIDYHDRYSAGYNALGQNLPTGMSRFTSGREAIQLLTPSATYLTIQQNPQMEIGLAKMFNNPEAGVQSAQWIGGYALGLTAGSKHPDEAFQFIKYITSDPTGVALFVAPGAWMPANIKVPSFRELGRDPLWRVFTEIAVAATKYRPAIPAYGTMNTELGKLWAPILRRQTLPQPAMEELSRRIDSELEKYK